MNRDQAKQLASDALEQLAKALEAGRSEVLKQYLAIMSQFHNYSFGNIMLIAFQCPNASQVAGFHTWHQMGRFVKKGEKGIMILAPIVSRKRKDEQPETDASDASVSTLVGFRPAYVFDISQTDGEQLPEFASVKGDPAEYMDRLKKLVEENGISLDYSMDILPARGISAGGKITLAPDLTAVETFSTLVHEFAHEALHKGERRAETTRQITPPTAEQVWKLIDTAAALNSRAHGIILVAACTGLRRGEILASTAGDIDWFQGEIVISKALSKTLATDGVHKWLWTVGEPKSKRSHRRVGVSERVLQVLSNLKQSAKGSSRDYYFRGKTADSSILIISMSSFLNQ